MTNAPRDQFIETHQSAGLRLWAPANYAQRNSASAEFLPDLGIWVATRDPYYALRARLRSYPVAEFLALVSRASTLRSARAEDVSAAMRNQGWSSDVALRHYQMALVVRLLLEEHKWPGPRSWPSASEADWVRELYECTVQASNVLMQRDEKEPQPDSGWGILIRVANQQFGDFDGLRSFVPRALLLFGECAREAEKENNVSLQKVLHQSAGLDIDSAMFVALGIYSLLFEGQRGHLLESNILTGSVDFPAIDESVMTRFFSWLSIDYDGYLEKCRAPTVAAEEGYEPYHFNPLVEYPFIATPSGHFVLPIPHYLFRRVTTGIFYDLIRSHESARASSAFGRSFERYVGLLIDDLPDHGVLMPEMEYAPGKRTCEWILSEPNAAVVIECKRIGLRQRAKTTGLRADLKRDIARGGGIADGVFQMLETVGAVRSGRVPGIQPTQRVISLLVTFDHFFLANIPYVREIIEEVIREEHGISIGNLEYQICPIADLEDVCRLLSLTRGRLSDALIAKIESEDEVPLDRPRREWEFGAWAHKVWPAGAGGGAIPSHDRMYSEGFPALLERFRSKGST